MDTITVETMMAADAPADPEEFATLGGPFVLQFQCASELIKQGCKPHSITFDEPQRKDDRWVIIGRGVKP